ncbi:hypothetical protein WH47_06945 [Habropoda laboriosa]|uniref:Uncharacterized protein n=1 Tax=Habropoda laboriosa TaxID=597456 RepID=A0A0L7RGZ4_9HYME|nr:hypothetical protein WH47_06945 [Habropoda laboriosa]
MLRQNGGEESFLVDRVGVLDRVVRIADRVRIGDGSRIADSCACMLRQNGGEESFLVDRVGVLDRVVRIADRVRIGDGSRIADSVRVLKIEWQCCKSRQSDADRVQIARKYKYRRHSGGFQREVADAAIVTVYYALTRPDFPKEGGIEEGREIVVYGPAKETSVFSEQVIWENLEST